MMITIADSFQESERCIALAQAHEDVFCAVGVHPHAAKEWGEGSVVRLRQLTGRSPKVSAIGEIGLDYHYDYSLREKQREAFEAQLRLAKELELAAVVHNRESFTDLLSIIRDVHPKKLVLHCCTERFSDVEPLLHDGYFLSFTGIATFPDAKEIRETILRCPLEQLMVETDAPYLAPVPYRGKRNEPAYVQEVVALIAQLKHLSFEEVDRATTENASRFFGLGSAGPARYNVQGLRL